MGGRKVEGRLVFWSTHSSTQNLLLILCSRITPDRIEPELPSYKANIISAVLSQHFTHFAHTHILHSFNPYFPIRWIKTPRSTSGSAANGLCVLNEAVPTVLLEKGLEKQSMKVGRKLEGKTREPGSHYKFVLHCPGLKDLIVKCWQNSTVHIAQISAQPSPLHLPSCPHSLPQAPWITPTQCCLLEGPGKRCLHPT